VQSETPMCSNNDQQSDSESDHDNYKTDKLQLNVGYQKSINTIVINKFVERYNHSLAPHRKKFAPSLRSLLQNIFDTIKFPIQEYNLGAKARHWYILKKFSDQPLYDCDLYNAL
ncbi:600_t:CDS:2, partial [Dentiscutata heterogama]